MVFNFVLDCSLHFDITKTLVKVCATNTLSLYYDSIEISNENEFNININYKVLNKLIQYSNDEEYTKINVYDNFIFVKYNNISILSRNIEGKYPNYSAVINGAIKNHHFDDIAYHSNFVFILVYIDSSCATKFKLVYSNNFDKNIKKQLNYEFEQ